DAKSAKEDNKSGIVWCFLAVKNLRRIKAFSPRRRKERKGRQEIRTCLLLLSVLCVLAVKILCFGCF
ncbi:MAG: hypothetical protein WCN64_16310, partial [Planctomycetota bacterium]